MENALKTSYQLFYFHAKTTFLVVVTSMSFASYTLAGPLFVGNVCCVGSTIKTYDYATGVLIASFTPDNDFNGRGVEVIGNAIYYTGSGERSFGAPNLHDIYIAPFNGGSGGHDIGIISSPRPDFGIQDLDYSNGILYALTGYFSGPPIVYALDPTTGQVLGSPVTIVGPSTGADGFTVLPNGNFLINDTDVSGIYREYYSSGISAGLPTGLVITSGDCCGVRYNAADNLLYYSQGTRTSLTGTVLPGNTYILGAGFEDITIVNIPEPSSIILVLAAGLIAGLTRRHARVINN